MTNRVTYAPQDFQQMCKQAERDHESKKLLFLMERVKKQIAQRQNPTSQVESPKPPVATVVGDSALLRFTRPVPSER